MNDLARRTWFTLAIAAAALAAGLAIAGAAVLGTDLGKGPSRAEAAKLTAFGSCDSLRSYLRRHRAAIGSGPITDMPVIAEDVAAAPGASAEAGGAPPPSPTATNVQEEGVDEPDIVKLDGTTILALAGNRLRAVATGDGAPAVLGSVELPGFEDAYSAEHELLLAGDRALVISRGYGGFGEAYAATTRLTEFDVSNPAVIEQLTTMRVEGSYVSGRLTGSTARVVVSAYPDAPIAESGHGRAWMPRAVIRDADGASARRSAVACGDVRRPKRFSGTTMLSVLTIDLERGLPAIDTDAVMTGGEIVYASPSSLYVATERWHDPDELADLDPAGVMTAIHRFDISEPDRTTYAGSGTVDGYMLSQWSMSEHEGVLRVASTSSPPWNPAGTIDSESYVTTLVPDGDRLAEVGRLDGIGRGEQIYAVRFIGPIGYVVTFRQVDPLHVIDLADPAEPRQAGELEIPGYSAYLHPVGPGLLLGVGQDVSGDGVTEGAEASLFDVSDPANPVRTDHVSLGRSSSTEVEYDHHAFTWAADQGLAVLPVSSWAGAGFQGAVGILVGDGGLDLTARTSQGSGPRAAIRRALVIDGLVYTLSERGVAVHDPATLERLALTSFAG